MDTEGEPVQDDTIDEETWKSIICLPDDVSLRTSDHHGSELKEMWLIWESWIETSDLWKVSRRMGPVDYGMLDSADELQASLYNSLSGFYRVAASCLRAALELMAFTSYLHLKGDECQIRNWLRGCRGLSLSEACDWFSGKHSPCDVRSLESRLMKQTNNALFTGQTDSSKGGWIKCLYWRLSDFAHARQKHTASRLWEGSNGPIYMTESFRTVAGLYKETAAAMWVLARLTRPAIDLPGIMRDVFVGKGGQVPEVAKESYKFLFLKTDTLRLWKRV